MTSTLMAALMQVHISKEMATIVAVERYKCMFPDHPKRIVLHKWKPNNSQTKTPVLIAE